MSERAARVGRYRTDGGRPSSTRRPTRPASTNEASVSESARSVRPGTWDVAVSLWMAPGAPPELSTGTSTTAWTLSGRYLEQMHVGSAMGQPFEGRGLTGYDNVQKKYVGTWLDTMGTGMMTSVGSVDETGTKFAFDAQMWDPTTGQLAKSREELVVESPDKHVMTMHATDSGSGTEFKTMELIFTRTAAKK